MISSVLKPTAQVPAFYLCAGRGLSRLFRVLLTELSLSLLLEPPQSSIVSLDLLPHSLQQMHPRCLDPISGKWRSGAEFIDGGFDQTPTGQLPASAPRLRRRGSVGTYGVSKCGLHTECGSPSCERRFFAQFPGRGMQGGIHRVGLLLFRPTPIGCSIPRDRDAR